MENELFFNWIDHEQLKTQLTLRVKAAKEKRVNETQKEVGDMLGISLTKIKEIENGTCKDFNAINNYINYFQEPLLVH